MTGQNQQPDIRTQPDRKQEQITASRQVVAGMAIAFTNFSIYPINHSLCQQSLKTFNTRLQVYLDVFGDLRLEVRERTLSLNDTVVYQENDEKNQLAALFYRDGIKWFELQEGINQDEISQLLAILKMNKGQQTETAGDVVTALWEANLSHLNYEAVDFVFEAGEIADPLALKSAPDDAVQTATPGSLAGTEAKAGSGLADYEKISVRLRRRYELELNQTEEETLKRMVAAEEAKNIDQDVLDILLIILDEQREEEEFKDVLSFIKEEFLFDLSAGEFKDICNLFTRLRKYQMQYRQEKPWASTLLSGFFQEISTAETVNILAEVLSRYDDPKLKDSLASMGKLFELMSPPVLPALALLLTKGYSNLVELPVLIAVRSLAKRDLAPLVKLLTKGEAVLVMKLFPIIASLQEEEGADLLYAMLAHRDERVRIKVLEQLSEKGKTLPASHYKLVDDPNPTIRRLVLKLLGGDRTEFVESFLLDYLENQRYTVTEDNHILTCFRALGSCGSGRSLTYLSKTLTDGAWKGLMGMDKTVLRNGAALALSLLANPAAKKILREGAASKYAVVKEACTRVLGEKR